MNGECYDSAPCSGGMDLGLMIQTSNKATENEYETEKNAIADIVGQLNLGLNKVHVGFMYYSRRSRNTLTLSQKDQVNKKRQFYVDRVKQLPYMPFTTSPLAKTLELTSEKMFLAKRPDKSIVPRLAVLFNDNRGDESMSEIIKEANEMKQKGIELYTVAIGESVDENQLKAIASSPLNMFKVSSHQSIYSEIGNILQSFCTAHAIMYLDKPELIKSGRDDHRYFKIELTDVKSESIEIKVDNLEGMSSIYWSLNERNPTWENSGTYLKSATRLDITSGKTTGNLLVNLPDVSARTLYFTVVGETDVNEVNVVFRNSDVEI